MSRGVQAGRDFTVAVTKEDDKEEEVVDFMGEMLLSIFGGAVADVAAVAVAAAADDDDNADADADNDNGFDDDDVNINHHASSCHECQVYLRPQLLPTFFSAFEANSTKAAAINAATPTRDAARPARLTLDSLSAMTWEQIGQEAAARAGMHSPDCIRATIGQFSGFADNSREFWIGADREFWIAANEEVQSFYFDANPSHFEAILNAFLGMREEAMSSGPSTGVAINDDDMVVVPSVTSDIVTRIIIAGQSQ